MQQPSGTENQSADKKNRAKRPYEKPEVKNAGRTHIVVGFSPPPPPPGGPPLPPTGFLW